MAGEALEAPQEEGPTPSPRRTAKKAPPPKAKTSFSPFLKVGAALRRGTVEPRPIKLARLGVSGQGTEGPTTPVPTITDPHLKELELAPIKENFSYVRITYHDVRNEHMYEVIEPPLTPIEKELFDRLARSSSTTSSRSPSSTSPPASGSSVG